MSRVVLTGIGLVSSLGLGHASHWSQVAAGVSGVAPLPPDPLTPLPLSRGARVEGFDLKDHLSDRKLARTLNAATGLSFVAAQLALQDAGLDLGAIAPERRGLYCQTGMFQVEGKDLAPIVDHCCPDGTLSLATFGSRGMSVINPFLPIKSLPNMGLGILSMHHDLQGPNLVAGPFAAQGAMLLELARCALLEGAADVCLVVGADAPFNVMTVASLLAMTGMDPDPVLGEVGVCLVLEREEAVRSRGGSGYASLEGTAVAATGGPEGEPETSSYALDRAAGGATPDLVFSNAAPLGAPAHSFQPQTGLLLGTGLLVDVAHAAMALVAGTLPERHDAPLRRVVAHTRDLSNCVGAVSLRRDC